MNQQQGSDLVAELLGNPRAFYRSGKAYRLLQCYFHGFSKETLRPLLRSDDIFIQRSAVFVISELGNAARELIDDLPRLLAAADAEVQWGATESIAVCATDEYADRFAHVALMLDARDPQIRQLAMRLVVRADAGQLRAAADRFASSGEGGRPHFRNLSALLGEPTETAITAMLSSDEPLTRRYGAIAAVRHLDTVLEERFAKYLEDPDVCALLTDKRAKL